MENKDKCPECGNLPEGKPMVAVEDVWKLVLQDVAEVYGEHYKIVSKAHPEVTLFYLFDIDYNPSYRVLIENAPKLLELVKKVIPIIDELVEVSKLIAKIQKGEIEEEERTVADEDADEG